MINKNTIKEKLHSGLAADEIFVDNEIESNKQISNVMIFACFLMILSFILNAFGVFDINEDSMAITSIVTLFQFLIPVLIAHRYKYEKRWIKNLLLFGLIFGSNSLYVMLSTNVIVFLTVPVVLSVRYYYRRLTAIVSLISVICMPISMFVSTIAGNLDMRLVPLKAGTVVTLADRFKRTLTPDMIDYDKLYPNVIVHGFIPIFIQYSLIAVMCTIIADKGRRMILEQKSSAAKHARIASELELASSIQAQMLPCIFPAFPNHKEFDIYATMHPAKEVGGDFYDMFMVDDNHVNFLIADVSGKGVPAALFMTIARTLIKDYSLMGLEPAEVFMRTNEALCEGNENGLFVTAWMGSLELNTGLLKYVNAGHNPPLIKKLDGQFEYLKTRHGFVLAGMEGTLYRQNEFTLEPGDKVFLYTDGVTEATNSDNKLFGEQRLLDSLNEKDSSPAETINLVKEHIDNFVGNAEQFDDITMLAFKYIGPDEDFAQKTFVAVTAELNNVLDFIDDTLRQNDCDEKTLKKINIAVEEIFVNVANYAYRNLNGNAIVKISVEEDTATISIMDKGVHFNPLEKEAPDISLSADERSVGGLGIMMTKKLMDDVSYQYIDNNNVLTLKKTIK